MALRLRHQPQTDMSQWQDGAQIRVEGVLQATGEPLRGPISHQPALFCNYFGNTSRAGPKHFNGQIPHWHGLLAASCELRTRSGRLQVMGVPSLNEVPISSYDAPQTLQNAALHLATTDWQQVPDLAELDLGSLQQQVMAGYGAMPTHLINRPALELLQMQVDQSSEADVLARLKMHRWRFGERLVAPGAAVTLVGTFRASPPGININTSVATPQHALYLGGADKNAGRQLTSNVIFMVVLATLTAAAHALVHTQQGALYLQGLRAVGLIDG